MPWRRWDFDGACHGSLCDQQVLMSGAYIRKMATRRKAITGPEKKTTRSSSLRWHSRFSCRRDDKRGSDAAVRRGTCQLALAGEVQTETGIDGAPIGSESALDRNGGSRFGRSLVVKRDKGNERWRHSGVGKRCIPAAENGPLRIICNEISA